MSTLQEHLRDRISREGAIDIAAYMEACLSHPDYGYYLHHEPFGGSGDFITAPEISQMFGELLGLWAVHQWHAMDKPGSFNLVELGPGRGTLMADALRAARGLPEFAEAMDLHLVETSDRLRAHQKQALTDCKPTWHKGIDTLPDGPAIVIANEFFDALPIHQFEYTEHGWLERRVGLDGDTFVFAPWPPSFSLEAATLGLQPKVGDVFEVSPISKQLVQALAKKCKIYGGCALFIDYGHATSGFGDTLQAVKNHAYSNVLDAPGEADLTAHVDFQALMKVAQAEGALTYGAVSQGAFLKSLGIMERAEALQARATPEQLKLLLSGRDRLINADQMGTLFKVVAMTGPEMPVPSGFQNNS